MRNFNYFKKTFLALVLLLLNCLALGGGASSLSSDQDSGFNSFAFFLNLASGGASNAETSIQLDSTAQAEVSSRLLDSNSNPIVGATVEATLESSQIRSTLITRAVTDSNGRFTLRLRFGRHLLRIRSSSGVELGTLTLEVTSLQGTPIVSNLVGNFSLPTFSVNSIAVNPTPTAPTVLFISKSANVISGIASGVTSSTLLWNASSPGSWTLRRESSDCLTGSAIASGTATAAGNITTTAQASSLALGSNSLRFCLVTSSGGTADLTTTVIRDDSAPTVGASPAGLTGAVAPQVVLSCTDTGGSTSTKIAWSTLGTPAISGTSGSITSGTEYVSAIPIPNNATTNLRFVCRDEAGNVSSVVSEVYTIDSNIPTLTIASTTPNPIGASGNASISWSSNLAGSYQVRIGGSQANCSDGILSTGSNAQGSYTTGSLVSQVPASQLNSGDNTIRVCVTTSTNLTGIATSHIVKDSTPPTIVSSSPGNGSTSIDTNLSSVSLVFSEAVATSNLPGKLSFSPSGRTATYTSYDSATRTALYTLSGGNFEYNTLYTLQVASGIEDTVGNVMGAFSAFFFRTKTFEESVDPTVSLVSLSNSFLSNNPGAVNQTSFRFSSNQNGSYSLRRASSSCNDGTVIASGSLTAGNLDLNISASELGIGSNALRFCLSNSFGRIGQATATVTRDDTIPTLVQSPGSGSFGVATQVTLSCTDSGGAGVDKIAFTNSGSNPAFSGSTISTGSQYSTAISLVMNQTTEIRSLCRDNAGNLSSIQQGTYTLDNQVPTVTIASTNPVTIGATGTVSLQWSGNENGSYSVRVGGTDCSTGSVSSGSNASGNYTGGSLTSSIPTSQLSNGTNTIRICLADSAGNQGIATASVSKDTTPPSISTITPVTGTTGVARDLAQISITFSEPVDSGTLSGKLSLSPAGRTVTYSSYDAGSRTATYTLSGSNFPELSVISIQIASGITDTLGNDMGTQTAGSFTTKAAEWVMEAYLKASNAEASDFFGSAIAIDGDTVVVGASGEDSNQITITNGTLASSNNSASGSGAVYVFHRVNSTWSLQAYIKAPNAQADDRFGYSVSISGDTLAIGASLEDSNQSTITNGMTASSNNSFQDSGAVYIFQRSGNTWSQQAYIKQNGNSPYDCFGEQISLDGDVLVVGAQQVGDSSPFTGSYGYAKIFTRSGTSWTERTSLIAGNALSGKPDGFARHGSTQSNLSLKVNMIAIGAPYERSLDLTITNGSVTPNQSLSDNSRGAVFIFNGSGNLWTQEAHLKPSNGDNIDLFGYSVSMHSNKVVVGAPGEDSNQNTVTNGSIASSNNSFLGAGAAYLFEKVSSNWVQTAYLKPSNNNYSGVANESSGWQFGTSVSIFNELIVISAPYERSAQTTITNGDGSNIATNSDAGLSGAVYIFGKSSSNWVQQAYIKPPNTDASDNFGLSVMISNQTIVVGAPGEGSNQTTITNGTTASSNNSAVNSGAAYVFVRK